MSVAGEGFCNLAGAFDEALDHRAQGSIFFSVTIATQSGGPAIRPATPSAS